MEESADGDFLGSLGGFLQNITGDITSAYKTFNQPTNVPVPGSQVPGRPGYVYGAGGSIQAVNPATGGVLPAVNSLVGGGATTTTVILAIAVGLLGLAFLFSMRR